MIKLGRKLGHEKPLLKEIPLGIQWMKKVYKVAGQSLLSGSSRMPQAPLLKTINHPHEIKCMHGSEYIVMRHTDVEINGELEKKNR